MYIHVLDMYNLSTSNRLPCFAEPTLGNENSDEQMQMSDAGFLKLYDGYEIDGTSIMASKIHAHLPPTVVKVDF
jgi:hypothetical protein